MERSHEQCLFARFCSAFSARSPVHRRPGAKRGGGSGASQVALLSQGKRELETLYYEYDKDKSGHVTKDELLPMMRAAVEGIPNLKPHYINEDDVDELWFMSDTDGNGSITKAELLLSLSSWRDRMKAAHDPGSVERSLKAKRSRNTKPARAVTRRRSRPRACCFDLPREPGGTIASISSPMTRRAVWL